MHCGAEFEGGVGGLISIVRLLIYRYRFMILIFFDGDGIYELDWECGSCNCFYPFYLPDLEADSDYNHDILDRYLCSIPH